MTPSSPRDRALIARVARALGGPCRVEPGSRILVAVSGGPDSIALLHLLRALAPDFPLSLHAAHFHHRLRGEDADEDARFVAETCERLGVPLAAGEPDAPIRRRGVSPEAAAREARYAFLERAARETGAHAIALGHTRDDQAETVLMRLLVGAGPRGLAGMAPCGPRLRVRPLLGVSRARLRRYVAQNEIPFRVDPSNEDPAFLRNRIRERVIPLIEKEVHPSARRTLARTAALFREIEEHLDAAAAEALERIAERSSGKIRLAGASLLTYDSALRRYVLRAAARELLGGRGPLYSVHIESVMRLLEAGRTGASIELPGGARAQFGGGLVITRDSAPVGAAWGPVPLEVPGDTHLEAAGAVIRSVIRDGMSPASVPRGPEIAAFDLGALLPPLVARSRRPGDRFVPYGARGSRKVQDALVDAKVPRQRRDRVIIVEDCGGIIWIAGVRRAARAPVTESSTRILLLETVREQR